MDRSAFGRGGRGRPGRVRAGGRLIGDALAPDAPEPDDEATGDPERTCPERTCPERTCIVTRQVFEPARLIRFVVGPDGRVVPDIRARLPGRGAWVSLDSGTVAQAVRRKAFARSFKRDCVADADLPAQVDRLLEQDALQALSFANKAGHVVCGAAKIEAALAGGAVRAVLHAVDGSPDGVRKITAAARRHGTGNDGGPRHIQIFSSSQLDLALGRSNVIHAALLAGGAGGAVVARVIRLDRFRGNGPVEGAETLDDNVTDAI